MNLWERMFQTPAVPEKVSADEINKAMEWLFSDFNTAALKLAVIKRNALKMRRAGCPGAGDFALVALWHEKDVPTPFKQVSVRNLPIIGSRGN